MKQQSTNPIAIRLTAEQFELAAQQMRNLRAYLSQCQIDNQTPREVDIFEFEYSAFLEEY